MNKLPPTLEVEVRKDGEIVATHNVASAYQSFDIVEIESGKFGRMNDATGEVFLSRVDALEASVAHYNGEQRNCGSGYSAEVVVRAHGFLWKKMPYAS